jgi:uncharacterized membrane protein (UPF0127 family)
MFRLLYKHQKYKHASLYIKGKKFDAIIADTPIKRAIGLMFRPALNNNECMLIKFKRESFPGIWMHNMLFAIDIIWLDKNMKIVEVVSNAKPCKLFDCKTYIPSSKAQYVIEMNAGLAKKLHIKCNEKIDYKIDNQK